MAQYLSDDSVVLSVQILSNGQRSEIVMPLGASSVVSRPLRASEAVSAFDAVGVPLLAACLSVDAEITGVAAEPMTNGDIPDRVNYPSGSHPGTFAGAPAPNQVAAEIAWYTSDPTGSNLRTRVGKTAIPGIPAPEVVDDHISAGLQAVLVALATALQDGSIVYLGGAAWRRLQNADRVPAALIAVSDVSQVRGYVTTQRRRLLPR